MAQKNYIVKTISFGREIDMAVTFSDHFLHRANQRFCLSKKEIISEMRFLFEMECAIELLDCKPGSSLSFLVDASGCLNKSVVVMSFPKSKTEVVLNTIAKYQPGFSIDETDTALLFTANEVVDAPKGLFIRKPKEMSERKSRTFDPTCF